MRAKQHMKESAELHSESHLLADTTAQLNNRGSVRNVNGDYSKFVYHMPASFDKRFEKIDDVIIRFCQRHPNIFFKIFSKLMTVITTIEIGIATPIILFLTNMDSIAVPILYIMIALSIISQIPKRFLFRKRPHVQGRAIKLAKDHTSSFPSRAVTCSVIYGFFTGMILDATLRPDWTFHLYTSLPITIFLILGSSFSRIYLGVHFPSDCFFAILQALIATAIGTSTYYLQKLLCHSCYDGSCYGTRDQIILPYAVDHINWYMFSILTVTCFITAILCSVKPLQFYVKFHHVFGLLLPCLTFQLTFLCKGLSLNGNTALGPPVDVSLWYRWLGACGFTGIMTVVGMKSIKDKFTGGQLSSILTFVAMYSICLVTLILSRGYYV